jgi:hypothetical protein
MNSDSMCFGRYNRRNQQWAFHSGRPVDSNASHPHNTLHRPLAHNNAFRSGSNLNHLVWVSLDTGKLLPESGHKFEFPSQGNCLPRNIIDQEVDPANMTFFFKETLFFKEYAPRVRANKKSCCFCIYPGVAPYSGDVARIYVFLSAVSDWSFG